jgi:hypothetical protein
MLLLPAGGQAELVHDVSVGSTPTQLTPCSPYGPVGRVSRHTPNLADLRPPRCHGRLTSWGARVRRLL